MMVNPRAFRPCFLAPAANRLSCPAAATIRTVFGINFAARASHAEERTAERFDLAWLPFEGFKVTSVSVTEAQKFKRLLIASAQITWSLYHTLLYK
jgi:hypothetical protein